MFKNTAMQFTKAEQHAIVSILISIMEADGVIHPNEISFLNKVLEKFSITEAELVEIPSYDSGVTKYSLMSLSEENRELVRQLFVGMANCDGFIHPREIEIINSIFD